MGVLSSLRMYPVRSGSRGWPGPNMAKTGMPSAAMIRMGPVLLEIKKLGSGDEGNKSLDFSFSCQINGHVLVDLFIPCGWRCNAEAFWE